ncbi:Cys-Gln thioester bond-forming surface protein [Streptomyces sp. FH025]|uniref:Cys-Gln thioester bond-forming surface protein n=1 Tax=Streptomyces sp. FH025 TaxID=2815937 RepID=UPI001A9D18FD|nr:Cys-Gln thioester bond-forming surface protein [Streptomyces sp. FH025]MBO1416144.1 Cys-Gln thioester bond-forming surface protein [Streptomyces sp. FH025]
MLTTSLALGGGLFAAGAAAAAGTPASGVTAVVQNTMLGEKVDVEGGGTVDAGLFTLKTADGQLQTYCIDFGFPVDIRKAIEYQESDWSSSSLGKPDRAPAAAKIRWILENSYPQVKEAALAKAIGVDSLTAEDAAAGTQSAIWKFSDNKNATPHSEGAKKLRDYLVSDANKGIAAEPKPSLSLNPDSVSGKSGGKLGPFTLNSSAAEVKLAVSGPAADKAKLVDKDGKPVGATLAGPIAKDTQLFLDVPAGTPDGSVVLNGNVETVVPSGRVFLSKGYTADKHSQTMILAGSSKVSVAATAKATWKQGKGALIDSSAKVECVNNGVRVSVTNGGDEAGTVTVGKQQLTVQPGKTETVLVKVEEKTAYDITVTGPNGYSREFQGVLDCKTSTGTTPSSGPSTPASTGTPSTGTPSATPSSTAGQPAPATTSAAPGTGGLAQTGANDSTPILAAVAGGLVVAGGAAVFVLRRRGRHGRTTA